MKEKWIKTAAIRGHEFDDIADVLFDENDIEKSKLQEADVFFCSDKDTKERLKRVIPSHMKIMDKPKDFSLIQEEILLWEGSDFVSRIGHDIVNLFMPLRDYEYLSRDTILERVDKGDRLGKQINVIGHMIQDDIHSEGEFTLLDFVFNFKTVAQQNGIDPEIIDEKDEIPYFSMGFEKIMLTVLDEIVHNWKAHSKGDEKVIVDRAAKKITFINNTNYKFDYENVKAVLRRPCVKCCNNDGNGLGLFIVSLAGVRGDFQWDMEITDSKFILHLQF